MFFINNTANKKVLFSSPGHEFVVSIERAETF